MWKSSIFGQKPWLSPLENLAVLHFLKLYFFCSLNHFFFIQNIKKQYFLTWFLQKTQIRKNFDFWTKSMDYPLRKMSLLFRDFNTVVLRSKSYSFLSKISWNDFFNTISLKTLMRKSLNFGQKAYTNFVGKKIDFLVLFTTLSFWSKNRSFLSKVLKNHLFWLD